MRNIPKLSHLLVAGILAILAMCSVSSAAFAYSYNTYNYSDEHTDPVTKEGQIFRLAIPKGLTTVKGILVVGSDAYVTDFRDCYTYPVYEEFISMYGFAYVGTFGTNSHVQSVEFLLRGLTQLAKESGHNELLNVPFVTTGSSAGGGLSSRLAVTCPDRVIASVPCMSRLNLTNATVTAPLLNTPILDIAGDTGVPYVNPNLKSWRPAPHNALWSAMVTQGFGRRGYVMPEVLSMLYLERVLQLRYPDGGDPSKGPLKLNTLAPGSGWIADNTTVKSGLTSITPASQFTGDREQSSWLPDKDTAYAFRAYSTWDATPGFKLEDFSNAIREIRLTSPALGLWSCQVKDPGPVTMRADVSIFVKNFPTWSKLEFYDGSTKLGETVPPEILFLTYETSASLTVNILKPGYHVLSVLGYDASGKAVRTSNPTMVIIRGKYQYPKDSGS